jgi:predicted double-glycine peptidase
MRAKIALMMLACTLTASPLVAGTVGLTPDTAGANYRIRTMSWAEIPFRSVIRQQYDFSCGSAAVATLLTYHYGIKTPEIDSFKAMWARGDQGKIRQLGFSMLDMKSYLQTRGLNAQGYRFKVSDIAASGRPGIALIDLRGFKHFVVVKGVRGNRVLVGDSILGITEYATQDFEKMWNGIYLAIGEADQSRRPAFNLANDWGPWSKAPLEANVLTASAADATRGIPPIYQLRPEILLDVRVGTAQ